MINNYISKKNIAIMNTIYRGIDQDKRDDLYRELVGIFYTYLTTLRTVDNRRYDELKEKLKEGKLGVYLDEIHQYTGTEETCEMVRKMIEAIKPYWEEPNVN